MAPATNSTTFASLSSNLRTSVVSSLDVGLSRQIAVWTNDGGDVAYENITGHTFSYYLKGGEGSTVAGNTNVRGGPGKICLIPDGSSSGWSHPQAITFVHLYMTDQELRRMYALILERDSRLFNLPEISFGCYPTLGAAGRQLAYASSANNVLLADAAISNLISAVFETFNKDSSLKLYGGLSPASARRTRDYIDANLGNSIRLANLAEEARLSQFHFQRMFIKSFGVSPQVWVTSERIRLSRRLLKSQKTLASIAFECGFADQSHFTRAFKRAVGMSPAAYRKAVIPLSHLLGDANA